MRSLGLPLAVAVCLMALAGCGSPTGPGPSENGSHVTGTWSEVGPGHFVRAAGIDFDGLAKAHAAAADFTMDLPGRGAVMVHAMPHSRPALNTWTRAESGWEHGIYLEGLSWGHGALHGFGYDGGGADTGKDSSLELVAAPAGWDGVVGVVDKGRETLYRLWLEPGPDRQPQQHALVEATSCYRPHDYTWIYGCGSRPLQEGEVAPR